MKKINQSPPDLCQRHLSQQGFAHLFVVLALAAVALGSGLFGYKFIKESDLSTVEGLSISQADVRYMTLEGRFVESNGSTPLVGIAANGGIMKPKVEIVFKNGTSVLATKVFEGKVDGTFSTNGLIVPAGAKTFTITPKVFRVKAQDLGVLTGSCSTPAAYTNCDVLKASSTDRTKKITNVNFVSTLNFQSPTASIKFLDGAAPKAIKPGDKFKVEVTSKAQEFVPLKDVKLMMSYSYYAAEEVTCQEFNVPAVVVQGPILTPVKGVVSQVVEITAPAFPTSTTHTYATPKFLTIYPVVTTKALMGRGTRFCSGSPLNTGIPCENCTGTAAETAKCERKLSLWNGCGTSYIDFGQGIVTAGASSVKGAQLFIPVVAGTQTPPPTDPDAFNLIIKSQRIGAGDAPKLRVLAKDKTVVWDAPITSTTGITGTYATVPAGTTLDDIKVIFVNGDNDGSTAAKSSDVRRALKVTSIDLFGKTYYTKDIRVYSQGSSPTCGSGYTLSETLYCKESYFQFSSLNPTQVELRMMGTALNSVYPTVELRDHTQKVWAKFSVTGTMQSYKTLVSPKLVVWQMMPYFVNDAYAPPADRNLRVDYLSFGGKLYQTEDPTTYKEGSYSSATKSCTKGWFSTEWLNCNGFLQYGIPMVP